MVFGVSASSKGDKAKARKWILATIFFGVAFIVLHLIEWRHLLGEGLTPFYLPKSGRKLLLLLTARHLLPCSAQPSSPSPVSICFTLRPGAIYLLVVAARVKN